MKKDLEDARRGEAEARGEVEFLRGEIERARLELRREREKASKALAGADAAVGEREKGSSPSNDSRGLEQRDDEIRGLKAIIHSLSSGPEMGSPGPDFNNNGSTANSQELTKLQESISTLQREKSDLKGLVDRKNLREEELEWENARLRDSGGRNGSYGMAHHSKTESSSTATMHTANRNSNVSATTAIRPGSTSYSGFSAPLNQSRLSKNSGSGSGSRPVSEKPSAPLAHGESELAVQEESQDEMEREAEAAKTEDSASVSVDTDSPWCELCETSGHDVLTCSRMFGEADKRATVDANLDAAADNQNNDDLDRTITQTETTDITKKSRSENQDGANDRSFFDAEEEPKNDDARDKENTAKESSVVAPSVSAQPAEGTAPGKSSGVVDMTKWCAMCEKDGHESVDCPFEDDYY